MKNTILIAIVLVLIGVIGGCEPPPADDPDRAAVDGYFTDPASSTFVLQPGTLSRVRWRFTTNQPASNWTMPSFSVLSWSTGYTGFYGGDGSPQDSRRTLWPNGASKLWLRATFSISSSDINQLMFWGRWDDTIEIYINGVLAAKEAGWSEGYRYLGLTPEGRAALVGGATNTVAVFVVDAGGGTSGSRYFDLGIARNQTLTSRPMAGFERTTALSAFGNTVRQYMIEHGIPAGVVAVMKNDQVVVNRAFGWTRKDFATALPANAVLRLASNDKMITKAAVRLLIDSGAVDPVTGQTITNNTLVFPLLVAHGITPAPGLTPDARINQITVQHLIDHQSGLKEIPEPADDANFYSILQVTPETAAMADDVRWVYSYPLDFTPGTGPVDGYSSSGYMVLRYLVHAVTGDLLGYLRNTLLAPVGTSDVFIAAERLDDRSPREPWYATLQVPYDRWINLENYSGLGASSEAMVRFMRGYALDTGKQTIDPDTGAWMPELCTHPGYVFFGGMAGTTSITAQSCSEQVSIAVIFNIGGNYNVLLDKLMAVGASLSGSDWGI